MVIATTGLCGGIFLCVYNLFMAFNIQADPNQKTCGKGARYYHSHIQEK